MSRFQTSAALTGALLASKGAAAPSGTVSSLIRDLPPKLSAAPGSQRAVERDPEADENKPRPTSGRAKLSFRLDRDRHLRLKLVSAHLQMSSQAILLAALDQFLSQRAPDINGGTCACLTENIARKGHAG